MLPEVEAALLRAINVLNSDAGDTEAFEATLTEIDHALTLEIPTSLRIILTGLHVSTQAQLNGNDTVASIGLEAVALMLEEAKSSGDDDDQATH